MRLLGIIILISISSEISLDSHKRRLISEGGTTSQEATNFDAQTTTGGPFRLYRYSVCSRQCTARLIVCLPHTSRRGLGIHWELLCPSLSCTGSRNHRCGLAIGSVSEAQVHPHR